MLRILTNQLSLTTYCPSDAKANDTCCFPISVLEAMVPAISDSSTTGATHLFPYGWTHQVQTADIAWPATLGHGHLPLIPAHWALRLASPSSLLQLCLSVCEEGASVQGNSVAESTDRGLKRALTRPSVGALKSTGFVSTRRLL